MEGTVKFFNRKKGFGFIHGDDGNDYFVHFSALPKGTFLHDNDTVSFEGGQGERGLKADKVQLLSSAPPQESGYGQQSRVGDDDDDSDEDDDAEEEQA